MNKPEVITIGESMVVFNSVLDISMIDSPLFIKQLAGAESNFAIGLSRLGHNVGWISRLSDDSLGHYVNHTIRGNGVDTSMVEFDDENPTGLLIKERLIKDQVNVHYYRNQSAASMMEPTILNETYFSKAKYLFITGITPALSESCKQTIFAAVQLAKKLNIKVIFDPNVRYKLASNLEDYKNTLNELAKLSDIFLPGVGEAKFLCGFNEPEEIAQHYLNLNSNLQIIIKLGAKGCYYANQDKTLTAQGYEVEHIVDPIGAGDAFAAGLTSSLLEEKSIEEALDRANLIGSMITQTAGDVEGFPFKNQLDEYIQMINNPATEEVNR